MIVVDQLLQQLGKQPISSMPDLSIRGGPEDPIKIDDRLRIKLPNEMYTKFLQVNDNDDSIFITYTYSTHISIYPLKLWKPIEFLLLSYQSERILRTYLQRTLFYGQETKIGTQGRITIPKSIADRASIEEGTKVFLKGMITHIDAIPKHYEQGYIRGDSVAPEEEDAIARVLTRYNRALTDKFMGIENYVDLESVAIKQLKSMLDGQKLGEQK
jgi:AbrB family looped-hinge helix DNA binding protein